MPALTHYVGTPRTMHAEFIVQRQNRIVRGVMCWENYNEIDSLMNYYDIIL